MMVRRLCALNSAYSDANVWASLTAYEAAVFGIICWGMPVGLIFLLNELLRSSNLFIVVPSLIIWPASGVAVGLIMRWLSQRRASHVAR